MVSPRQARSQGQAGKMRSRIGGTILFIQSSCLHINARPGKIDGNGRARARARERSIETGRQNGYGVNRAHICDLSSEGADCTV